MNDTLLQAAAERRPASSEKKPLQRLHWLQKALEIFVAEGIDAVRITRLAQDLDVTRGSFYWHFENREDLIDALVSYWKSKNTPAITDAVNNASNLEEGILAIFEICIDNQIFDPRLDLALREWSRRSNSIRQQIDREDSSRVEAIQNFFIRCGYNKPEALIRARVLYYSQIGFYAIEVVESLDTRLEYTETYFECFTGQKMQQNDADRFRQRILQTYAGELS